jgi:hypothetical protein
LLAAVALLAIGGAAYGYFGVYVPSQRAAAAEQARAERDAREAAAEKQRLAEQAAEERSAAAQKLEEARRQTDEARRAAAQQAAQAPRPVADDGNASASTKVHRSQVATPKHSEGAAAAAPAKPSRGGDDPLAGLDGL